MAKVTWLSAVLDDVESIFEYIAAEDPSAALRLIATIVESVDQLESFPHSGRLVPGSDRRDVRQLVVERYLVVYRLTGDLVEVVAVRHGARRSMQNP